MIIAEIEKKKRKKYVLLRMEENIKTDEKFKTRLYYRSKHGSISLLFF